MNNRTSNDTRSKIRRLHAEGATVQQLKARFGLSERTLYTILGPDRPDNKITLTGKADKEALKNAAIPISVPSPYNFGSRSRGFQKPKGTTSRS